MCEKCGCKMCGACAFCNQLVGTLESLKPVPGKITMKKRLSYQIDKARRKSHKRSQARRELRRAAGVMSSEEYRIERAQAAQVAAGFEVVSMGAA